MESDANLAPHRTAATPARLGSYLDDLGLVANAEGTADLGMKQLSAHLSMFWCLILAAVVIAVFCYAMICFKHMSSHIGTGHYWSNVWFWRGHACVVIMALLRLLVPRQKGPRDAAVRDDRM